MKDIRNFVGCNAPRVIRVGTRVVVVTADEEVFVTDLEEGSA